uniref:AAA+ ATPase domain-containing protein n=1 Tax=Pseudo-nitzschia arenysensis TaxID=697910 RepID=A0A7S0F7J8_9STRA|mmetsp:Transcript_580/g.1374  ORF Transcript_580/g.1374 Transcript_580/m.1374 type:complete len:869 (+) Transcript_580:124-2730(+)
MNGAFLAELQKKNKDGPPKKVGAPPNLMAALKARKPPSQASNGITASPKETAKKPSDDKPKKKATHVKEPFEYHEGNKTDQDETDHGFFLLVSDGESSNDFLPRVNTTTEGTTTTVLLEVPLAPLVYRACDFTFEKAVRNQTAVTANNCVRKLGILRALQRERGAFNALLESRLEDSDPMEEEELGKTRFLELLSNGGVARKVVEILLKEIAKAIDDNKKSTDGMITTIEVAIDGLDDFLFKIEEAVPELAVARTEIETTQSVSFYPGLGELFCPGSKLVCYPEGMEGSPLGCSCVQSWYSEDHNQATGKTKRRFVLVIEFIISVGDELVFVAMTDVYPEFHDTSRNLPLKDLSHRKLLDESVEDRSLLDRLQQRGEFYASVATKNHFLEYYPDSFFPILKGGGWSSNAVRPLSKGGRVMVDVKRGILEGHIAVRSSSASGSGDATSDTVKEAIKLFESSKRTGIAVPFRTCVLPEKFQNTKRGQQQSPYQLSAAAAKASDRSRLWMSWPMLVGFSFTARVWGKLLLGMPKSKPALSPRSRSLTTQQRPSSRKFGVEIAALGGEGKTGNCGYISFQTQAFDQLVLEEDKKELIRAVARNAGGGGFDDEEDDESDDEDDFEDAGIDVVANKGGASIFLLHGPPGCGKTLTAEAIAELLEKPLYIVTAGDLGISASEVEKNLGSVLELCQTWDALVLIDEADVFLEARNSTEIARNALVCVMLRLLEYYSGCLFLSSNRSAGSIDAAIASRITVMLGYPKLDATGRGKVWKNLIELVPSIPIDPATGKASEKILSKPRKASRYRADFSASDYQGLAEEFELNGRQIKNSIVLARALARERKTPLNLSVLHRAVVAVAGEDVAASKTGNGY